MHQRHSDALDQCAINRMEKCEIHIRFKCFKLEKEREKCEREREKIHN